MAKRIRPSENALPRIRDKGSSLPRIDGNDVAAALNAESAAGKLRQALAPITLFAVREELTNRLQSSGGRPSLAGVNRRAKVPLSDKEWLELEELAVAISAPGFAPSAGQVASALLSLSVRSIVNQVSSTRSKGTRTPLLRELADLAALEARKSH